MVRAVRAAHLLALAGALCAGACKNGGSAVDGGTDGQTGDAPSGDLPGTLALDFAVTGCASYVYFENEPRCQGVAPMTVSFSPVSSPSFTRFLWTFGDGSPPSSERAAKHTYTLPGAYDVSLVAEGMVGSVSRLHARFVEVAPVPVGATCDVDAQCADGLRCLCGSGQGCGPAFARGICTRDCVASACAGSAACATLLLPASDALPANDGGADAGDAASPGDGGSPDGATDATAADGGPGSTGRARPLCLASCDGDAPCPAGLECRALPAGGGGAVRWTLACVPPVFRDVGATCRDATGALEDELCATGRCADLGALGLCSATCAAGAECPPGTACAALGNGQSLCLRACGADFTCDRDPLLRCEPAGSAGPLGFQVSPPIPGATYCAPRKCAAEAECDPAGTCLPLGAGGHCQLP
jgi:PKD repeat protein